MNEKSMSDIVGQANKLRKDITSAKLKMAELEGGLNEKYERLKSEFNVNTLENAEKLMKKKENELDKMENRALVLSSELDELINEPIIPDGHSVLFPVKKPRKDVRYE